MYDGIELAAPHPDDLARVNEYMAGLVRSSPTIHAAPGQKFFFSREIASDVADNYPAYVATFSDMVELGLANPPFECFTVVLAGFNDTAGNEVRMAYDFFPDGIQVRGRLAWERDFRKTTWNPRYSFTARFLFLALIVLLATPNVIKERQGKKKLAIGQSERDTPTTTILRIGKVEYEDNGISVPGVEPRDIRPHLRRGHIRQQVCGAGRAERKKIFVPPCFVNGDPAFYPKRDHYEVRMAANG